MNRIRKVISVLILLLSVMILFSGCVVGELEPAGPETVPTEPSGPRTLSVAELEGKFRSRGRTVFDSEGLHLYGTADSFEFNAECRGTVSVTAEVTGTVGQDWFNGVFFTVYVDGSRLDIRPHLNSVGKTKLVLAEGLENGFHRFELYRQTEWGTDGTVITHLTLDGTVSEPPAAGEFLIEFIGDSFTTGYGNMDWLEYDGLWAGESIYEDGTGTVGFMVCHELDYDYSVIALSGIGVLCGPNPQPMLEIYDRYPLRYDETYTYPSDRTADVVFIRISGNDYSVKDQYGYTDEDIQRGMEELVGKVRRRNPEAKIVLLGNGKRPSSSSPLQQKLGGEEAGIYFHNLPLDGNGHGSHPSVKGNENVKKGLSLYLRKLLGVYQRPKTG